MFGVPRLLAIAVENISRIDFVWPLCVPHLLRAAATGTGEVRACAVECYTKVRCMAKHLRLSVRDPPQIEYQTTHVWFCGGRVKRVELAELSLLLVKHTCGACMYIVTHSMCSPPAGPHADQCRRQVHPHPGARAYVSSSIQWRLSSGSLFKLFVIYTIRQR